MEANLGTRQKNIYLLISGLTFGLEEIKALDNSVFAVLFKSYTGYKALNSARSLYEGEGFDKETILKTMGNV